MLFDSFWVKLFGGRRGQDFLEYLTNKCQKFSGIGAGDDVSSSGEFSIVQQLNQLQPPYCIFDVGASRGGFVNLLLTHLQGQDYRIHCFEPSIVAFADLQKRYGNHEQIELNNMALGREPGKGTLFFNNPGSEIASLTRRKLDHFGIDFEGEEVVDIDTLDRYCLSRNIERIHLLKLDVEGHEFDILAHGASSMFSRKAVDMVSFEFGGCNIDTRTFLRDFFYFFKDTEMDIFRITPTGYLYPLESYKEIYEQFRTTNYLALRRNFLQA